MRRRRRAASTAFSLFAAFSLTRALRMWFRAVWGLMCSSPAICLVLSDSETRCRTSSSRFVSPNPPMDGARTGEGGKGVTGAIIRARIRVDGRLAGGLQALLGAPMGAYSGCGERDGRIGHGKRRSRTGLA